MKENILLVLQIITVDFFTAFGLYTLLFLIVFIFTKKQFLKTLDEEASGFISFVGVIYFLVWIIGIFVFYAESNIEEQNSMLNRMFGKYWVGYWVQPILWFSITQLLRIRTIRKNVLLRILFSFLLVLSIEKFVILITAFHRDYLPSSWTMYSELDIYPSNFFLLLLAKIMMFLLFVGIYYLIKSRLKVVIETKQS
jgi:molybdopterin-containing oxidoreductase family membrane subunit